MKHYAQLDVNYAAIVTQLRAVQASTHHVTVPFKQEILGYMKHMTETESLGLYLDKDLIAQINVERFEVTKTGQIQFSHPDGTHDDELWSLALCAYATRTPDTSYMGIVYGVPHIW